MLNIQLRNSSFELTHMNVQLKASRDSLLLNASEEDQEERFCHGEFGTNNPCMADWVLGLWESS